MVDSSLFIYNKNNLRLYFLVYVDDIIITGNNKYFLDSFILQLGRRFSLKDLGDLNQFLGIEVINTGCGLFLCQHRPIADLLETFSMAGAKQVNTP